MRYIKKFENQETPKIGDYVIMSSSSNSDAVVHFIENSIGQIIFFEKPDGVYVRYNNIPEHLDIEDVRSFYMNQIIHFASTKEELQIKIDQKKYNL